MRGRRLYHLALSTWLAQCQVLGFFSHYYSSKRRCLVHSRWLQAYHWFLMATTLVFFYPYWKYAMVYFEKGTFRRQDFIMQVSEGSVMLNLLTLIISAVLKVLYERPVGEISNELARILRKDLRQKEPTTSFYYIVFFAKFHNYLHNFNFALGVLMVLGMRTIRWADIFANIYYVYTCLSRESVIFCYALLLLDFGEALRLNSQQEEDSYGGVLRQLQRQERLKTMLRQVHRMFGWQVAGNMMFYLYFNMATIYLGYTFMSQHPEAMRQGLSHIKILLTAIGIVVVLLDGLILQIICEYLLMQGNRLCSSPKFKEQEEQNKQDFIAAQRQWEMSVLRRAITRARPENQVLGMFRMDMQCAFALISSSLSYGVIIIQLGYLPSVNMHN
ncbi:hypothetical protein KR067_010998 [Drosophila pandora]|nr:hypothetical protein KR067_010998 [Drosophila pandora]